MNKVLYIKDENFNLDINANETYEIYHYVINKSVNVVINLKGLNAKVVYHYSTINFDDNTFKITINHLCSNTISEIYNHGVNAGFKKLVFDVTGYVPKDSFKCFCNQENQIINLTNGISQILPNLLINNYDTFSNHAAYIGKFKEDILFYLMSRGINEQIATRLLLNGGNINEKVTDLFLKKLMEV